MNTFSLPTALDVVVDPVIPSDFPYGMLLAGILIAAVVVVSYLLIRRFYGKKK